MQVIVLDGTELAEALDDGLLIASPDGQIEAVNAAAAKILGRPREALVGARVAELLPDPALVSALAGAVKTRLQLRADGRPLDVRVVPRPPQAWLFVRAPPEPHTCPRQRADEYLRSVLRHAPLVLFSFDAHGVLTMSEGHGLDRLRDHAETRVGASIFARHADVPWILDAARRALAGEAVAALGEVGDASLEVHYGPVFGDDGAVSDVIGVAIDVTEREQAHAQLAAQKSVLKYILTHVPQSIFWKDRAGRFVGCNQHFLDHIGAASEDALIGKTDRDMFSDSHEVEFFQRIDQQVMNTGVPMLNIEESLLRPTGQQAFLLTSKVPLRDERSEVIGILGIYVDITERKRIELELQHAKEAADAALRAKSEFLTVMSHELRTPLTLVLAPLASLLADPHAELGEGARRSLTRIWRNAARLGRLVDDILDYQQIEADKLRLSLQPVEVRELVESIVLDAEPAADAADITLHLELARDIGTVAVDRRMFEKVLYNLLGNALKFTPRGGAVTVALARRPGGFQLSVADTGPGIDPAEHELVFQRFQQLDSSTTRAHEGSGLGLAIVREFVEKMGGAVTLESERGAGARFIVALPDNLDHVPTAEPRPAWQRHLPPAAALIPPPPPAAQPQPERPLARLVVAEDNPDMRAYIAEILGDDYAITLAANGAEALLAAATTDPDVIITDIMMPVMDGYELVSRLKAAPDLRDVPVVLLSARASVDDTARGLDIGADDYLAKPFAPEELRARVRAAVRLHRSHLEVVDALRSLKETQAQLVQQSKLAAVGTLVAGLSHELNNPIAIIHMSAQMLLRRNSRDPFVRRTLERIERQSQRCATLVESLLAYTRRRPQVVERCDLGQTLQWVLALVTPQARQRSVDVTADFAADALPALVLNRSALESALINVLTNAVDASQPGGAVEVSAQPRTGDGGDPGVEFTVRDAGAGIAPHDLQHVFEPFFTTKAPGKGTGLGLAMTQKFVQSQGGTITIESEVDRGTTVRIWLPTVVKEGA